jgi:hypothetical protein
MKTQDNTLSFAERKINKTFNDVILTRSITKNIIALSKYNEEISFYIIPWEPNMINYHAISYAVIQQMIDNDLDVSNIEFGLNAIQTALIEE